MLLVSGLVSFVTARSLTRPMRRLRAALTDAAGGNMEFRISHHRRDEIGALFDAFNLLAASAGDRMIDAEAALERTQVLAPAPAPPRQARPAAAAAPGAGSPFAAPAGQAAAPSKVGREPSPARHPSLSPVFDTP